ncbi:MAG: sensor histidine kinase [Comamonas sp.]|uniref:sensor histidine kinase n=1 Tax=Comamonas sp. TaxID=34028 RepID=UPI00284E908B|nr:sensor histidine kinase [Comamonas sp.]MDR3067588.1 sensor histidine kinase [Comamonas sp.]
MPISPLIAAPPASARPALVFDACNAGVVLRAVLFVQVVVGTAAIYGSESLWEWFSSAALLTGACLPGTLVWLITACSLKHQLQRLGTRGQYLAGVLLGALAGLYACGMLFFIGRDKTPWLASAVTGGLLAALLVTALVLRARGNTPAQTQARLTELQSRIRPHFLFNTLNSAIALVRAEPAKAEALLEDLSDLFRYALAEPHLTTTLAQEIELAQRYLSIEQVRFGDRLQMQWQLDESVHGALLPPLLLQPLVENAIRHGVEPSARGGKLQVRTERRGNQALIQIINTLPPASAGPQSTGHGMALDNVRARLSLLHDLQGSFSARARDGLYVVRLSVPLLQAAPKPGESRHAHSDR